MAKAQFQAWRCTTKVFHVKGMAMPAKLSPAAPSPTYPIWVASVSSFCCSCVFALCRPTQLILLLFTHGIDPCIPNPLLSGKFSKRKMSALAYQ